MSTPSRPAGSEPYIVAMANQADRSNRPVRFIVIGCVIVLACLVYMLFGVRDYLAGASRLQSQIVLRASTERSLKQIEQLENRNPDLLRLYPPGELNMPNYLREAATEAFGGNPEGKTQPDFFSVGDVERRPLESTRGQLNNSTVRVTVSGARALPIEDILTFVETAFEKDPSGLMFLSEFDLRPTPQGWQVRSLEFRRYSFNRNRQ